MPRRSLVLLADSESAWNQTWHVPIDPDPPTNSSLNSSLTHPADEHPAHRRPRFRRQKPRKSLRLGDEWEKYEQEFKQYGERGADDAHQAL
jgi:hypothetical protein